MVAHEEVTDDPLLNLSLDDITPAPTTTSITKSANSVYERGKKVEIQRHGVTVDMVDSAKEAAWATPEAGYDVYVHDGYNKRCVSSAPGVRIRGNHPHIKEGKE